MEVVAGLEICTMQINILLPYCTLLLTCQILLLWDISAHCYLFIVCCVDLCFFAMCFVLLPTSLAQNSHDYGIYS